MLWLSVVWWGEASRWGRLLAAGWLLAGTKRPLAAAGEARGREAERQRRRLLGQRLWEEEGRLKLLERFESFEGSKRSFQRKGGEGLSEGWKQRRAPTSQDGLLLWLSRFGQVGRKNWIRIKELKVAPKNKAASYLGFSMLVIIWPLGIFKFCHLDFCGDHPDNNRDRLQQCTMQGPCCVGHPCVWGLHCPGGLCLLWTCRYPSDNYFFVLRAQSCLEQLEIICLCLWDMYPEAWKGKGTESSLTLVWFRYISNFDSALRVFWKFKCLVNLVHLRYLYMRNIWHIWSLKLCPLRGPPCEIFVYSIWEIISIFEAWCTAPSQRYLCILYENIWHIWRLKCSPLSDLNILLPFMRPIKEKLKDEFEKKTITKTSLEDLQVLQI